MAFKSNPRSCPPPQSCDTFVSVQGDCVVFGKNSDRPDDEVQEVIYIPAATHPPGSKVKCTYIEVDQVERTHAVVLSRPSWLWGAEMGANEHGVVAGNEAVWTHELDHYDASTRRLLGMDLVRLALERADTAEGAVKVIGSLLEQYGQGGGCAEGDGSWTYENGFLVADSKEAWVVETAGRHWAAERVHVGTTRNISNELSIHTRIDLHSAGLQEHAVSRGFYDPNRGVPFSFTSAFSGNGATLPSPSYRYEAGCRLLKNPNVHDVRSMKAILRSHDGGLCMHGGFTSTGSQVSVLKRDGTHTHWFTATPNPCLSVFKPFRFGADVTPCEDTVSPNPPPRSGREHRLWHLAVSKDRERASKTGHLAVALRELDGWAEMEEGVRAGFATTVAKEIALYTQ